MECESLLDSEGTGNVHPRDQAADDSTTVEPVTAAAGTSADTGQPTEGPAAKVQSPGGVDGQAYKGSSHQPSVGDKAKAYLQKIKKTERIDEIKNCLGDKLLAYEAINAANRLVPLFTARFCASYFYLFWIRLARLSANVYGSRLFDNSL